MANEFQQAPQQGYQPQPGFQPGMPMGQGTPSLSFQDALQRWLANLTNFKGRARRSEFWWPMLAIGVASFILNAIFTSIGGKFGYFMVFVAYLAVCFAGVSVTVRRLQDTNKPGVLAWIMYGLMAFWALTIFLGVLSFNSFTLTLASIASFLLILNGILSIVIIVFCCMDSQPGTNQYGPSEKYPM